MEDLNRKRIALLANMEPGKITASPQNTLEALADFLAFLHAEGSLTDSDIATLYHAALMRQGKTYELGCNLLHTKFNSHNHPKQ